MFPDIYNEEVYFDLLQHELNGYQIHLMGTRSILTFKVLFFMTSLGHSNLGNDR